MDDKEKIINESEIKTDDNGIDKVLEKNISQEMKKSFLSYAMSVIVSRALPDVRDGLKPVHRRILYAMNDLGMYSDKPHKKSARIVGEVIGKYHPHGDSSVYDAMVRMAQDFSYRYPLVDGHGNFGSVDGDGAAAMRYTEARMSKISMELLRDLNKETVDFIDNYDASEKEPAVLPSKFPNILVNGSTGIAVGMATNIPPHNLGEVIDGAVFLMENPDCTIDEIMDFIKGPDFPTGGQLLGITGLHNAYKTGNGIVIIRAKTEIVEHNNKSSIIVTEIPYQVNKTRLIERIASLVKDKIIDGITDLRDESNRKGMRIVIELRKDVNPNVMLNNLYKHTQLQATFGINMIALVGNEPKTLTLKEILSYYIKHQVEIITRRTIYDLRKAEERDHILQGLMIALEDIDEVVDLLKKSKDGKDAKEQLISKYNLDDIQSQAILDMKLQRITGLEIEKIVSEHEELIKSIADYKDILASDERKHEIIKSELLDIKERFNDKRRTEINMHDDLSIENEDLIPREDVIVTLTKNGYIKRMNIDSYKIQNRGGVGVKGIKTNEDDYVDYSLHSSTHDYLLFFTNKGRVYKKKAYHIPPGSKQSKGLPIVNLLDFIDGEYVTAITNIDNFDDDKKFLFFATKKGIVKRTSVNLFKNIRQTGIIAISLHDEDELLGVRIVNDNTDVILGASNGKAIRFSCDDVRPMGRSASGVRGMRFTDKDYLVGMTIIDKDENDEILVITKNGFGKRSDVDEYRLQSRGGKGVKALNITDKNGPLVTLRSVNTNKDLIITTTKGISIRVAVENISKTGRATQGVRIMRLKDEQEVSTITVCDKDENEEIENTNEEVQIEE